MRSHALNRLLDEAGLGRERHALKTSSLGYRRLGRWGGGAAGDHAGPIAGAAGARCAEGRFFPYQRPDSRRPRGSACGNGCPMPLCGGANWSGQCATLAVAGGAARNAAMLALASGRMRVRTISISAPQQVQYRGGRCLSGREKRPGSNFSSR